MKPIKILIGKYLLNDNFWSFLAIIFSIVASLIHYFSGRVDKATFWMVVAIFNMVNLKD